MSTVSIDESMTKATEPAHKHVNPNLVSLKCLLFIFFGGMACIFPFLTLHMRSVGLTLREIYLISLTSSFVAIIGPLVVAPLADKLASRTKTEPSNGGYLRVMIAVMCVLSAISYGLLLIIPPVDRIEMTNHDTLHFSCRPDGAVVLQKRQQADAMCYNWTSESRKCSMYLTNCDYHCEAPASVKSIVSTEPDISVIGLESKEVEWRRSDSPPSQDIPHLCYHDGKQRVCHAYTNNTRNLLLNATFHAPRSIHDPSGWCVYPVSDWFSCRIPHRVQINSIEACSVRCNLHDPLLYDCNTPWEDQCSQVAGDPATTFWMYLIIRSVADIFPTAALTLINAAMVIATRETSCGRGDVGRQLAFGSFGYAIFGPIAGALNPMLEPPYVIPVALHAAMMILAAFVALLAREMPLSPPEWSWLTRSGVLAVPMSSVRRYGFETAAVVVVLLILGTFWSVIDTYLPLYLSTLAGSDLAVGLVLTIGALPAVIFLWKSEQFVDYCGHSNLLILAFTMYILRFVGLNLMTDPWWALLSEAMEMFTLGVMWITAILYMRHLMPHCLAVTAQALPVVAHFCIGRGLGVLIGNAFKSYETERTAMIYMYWTMAVVATVVAIVYFLVYHALLRPRCHAQLVKNSNNAPIVQGLRENGSYTPLRVFHNSLGRKGEFRY